MRTIRMLGLAAIAALAAMAFVGASSASAVTLCKVNQSTCESGNQYLSGTVLKASLLGTTKAVLTTDLAIVECAISNSEGKTTATSGSPLPGTISKLTFEKCETALGVPCTVTVLHLPYAASVAATGSGNGTLTVTSGGTGNPGATVVCIGVLNCTFSTSSATLRVEGGEPGMLFAEEISLERSGSLCPETATWTASYGVTAPTKGWVSENP